MARKLNNSERDDFLDAVEAIEALPPEAVETAFWRKLSEQRDTALLLTSELGEWFGKEFPTEIES